MSIALDTPQRAPAFRAGDALAKDSPDILGQPNVGLFGWTTNDLTSVKDIITYVNTAMQAAESAQANAKYVEDSLERMEILNTQYRYILLDIDAKYADMNVIYANTRILAADTVQYSNAAKSYQDATISYHDEVKKLRDEVIAFAMQSIYKYGESGNVPSSALIVNMQDGSVQNFTLTQAATNISFAPFTDPTSTCRQLTLMFIQGTGANVLNWPANVKWNNSRKPIFSYIRGKMDIVTVLTKDSGANWYGFYNGGWFDA